MIYGSIDMAKQGNFSVSSDGEILVELFQFSNNGNGFYYLVSAFEPFDDEDHHWFESTAHYRLSPFSGFLFKKSLLKPLE